MDGPSNSPGQTADSLGTGLKLEQKITLPRSKKYQRLSMIDSHFWLALPEWHMILVVSTNGDVVKEVKHQYIQQPFVVKDTFDGHVVIGARSGLFCMSAQSCDKCQILSDAKTTDVSTSENTVIAYDIRTKTVLLFRKTGHEWDQVKIIRPPKDMELDRILLGNDDQILVHFQGGKLFQYTKMGVLIVELRLDFDTKSPRNGSRMCCTDSSGGILMLNWYKGTLDYYRNCLSKLHSPSKMLPASNAGANSHCNIVNLLEVNNPNDFVITDDGLNMLAGIYILKYSGNIFTKV